VSSRTQTILDQLRQYESRNITFIDPEGSWPIVWERASGNAVWDAEGRKYLDLTAGFGVAAAGHANPRVVRAGQRQLEVLPHAMGDVHPHRLKAALARELSRITFERWGQEAGAGGQRTPRCIGKTIFCNSGFEAVEAALKTALLATGKAGIIAFEGGYHGLGYGALNATHRDHFRGPFRSQLAGFGRFVPFPREPGDLERLESALVRLFRGAGIGALLAEPIQARGGINVPPAEFLRLLRRLCERHGALLILDEVYTGFGRTGRWFACEHARVVPDLICLGKALTGGFPLSACVGKGELMDQAWPSSRGEAIHTSTFLGNPVGCAMALAQIKEIGRRHLPEQAAARGRDLLKQLRGLQAPSGLMLESRGIGLLVGLEVRRKDGEAATQEVWGLVKGLLRRGILALPEGEKGNVLAFSPPLTVTERQLQRAVGVVQLLLELSKNRTQAPTSHNETGR
jgi:4-aminobutyrate aminotransferase-like enzyme